VEHQWQLELPLPEEEAMHIVVAACPATVLVGWWSTKEKDVDAWVLVGEIQARAVERHS